MAYPCTISTILHGVFKVTRVILFLLVSTHPLLAFFRSDMGCPTFCGNGLSGDTNLNMISMDDQLENSSSPTKIQKLKHQRRRPYKMACFFVEHVEPRRAQETVLLGLVDPIHSPVREIYHEAQTSINIHI